ncbi:MAG: YitT family protein [Breznakia sp.]
MKLKNRNNQKFIIRIILGCLLYVMGINFFITPAALYSGGMIGIAQIIRTLLENAGLHFRFEISGILNFIFNIPLLIIAYRSISRRFLVFTLVSIGLQMLLFTIVPIPKEAIVGDVLTACIIGGLISGYGVGSILKAHGSGGGLDILGVLFSKRHTNLTVGRLAIVINAFIYGICAILFQVEIAIYSIIYQAVFLFVVDKVHYQNINTTAVIFTQHFEVKDYIIDELHRGVTFWEGKGGYTNEDTYIMMAVVSKYEISSLRNRIRKIDKNAFIIFSEGLHISGNFKKRL